MECRPSAMNYCRKDHAKREIYDLVYSFVAYGKFFAFCLIVGIFFSIAALVHLFGVAMGKDLKASKIRVSRFFNGLLLMILPVDLHYDGDDLVHGGSFLIVANHLSYLDVIVICSLYPACFITSVEMRGVPFLGWICRATGCLFVERRNRDRLDDEVTEIASQLASGNHVMLFPEGTSGDGAGVARFRKPLFRAAIKAGSKVAAICINYLEIDGVPVSLANRDSLFWYGKMTFFKHFLSVLKMRTIAVRVSLMEIITTSPEVKTEELAGEAHRAVESGFIAIRR